MGMLEKMVRNCNTTEDGQTANMLKMLPEIGHMLQEIDLDTALDYGGRQEFWEWQI